MAKRIQNYPPLADEIIKEVYRSIELMGADEQLLALIGSWNETLPDETVLEGLRFWIECKKDELRRQTKQKPLGKPPLRSRPSVSSVAKKISKS